MHIHNVQTKRNASPGQFITLEAFHYMITQLKRTYANFEENTINITIGQQITLHAKNILTLIFNNVNNRAPCTLIFLPNIVLIT